MLSNLQGIAALENTANLSYAFLPDAGRARRLDRRMRLHLADSLDYLRETIAAQWGEDLHGLVSLIGRMRAGAAYPPSTFGLYYEIANTLLAGEREKAMTLFAELCAEQPLPAGGTEIIALDDLRPAAAIARYLRLMDTDTRQPFRIKSPPPDQAEAFRRRLKGVQQRAQSILPSLADEISQLIREIVLVVPQQSDNGEFAGGSCYMLWGALLLNVEAYADDMLLLQALAHESAHTLLFGFTTEEPLVLNDADTLFSSPLRDDPRPMDGILHATYVCARMHWAMSTALKSGTLNSRERASADAACQENIDNFFAGYDTVMRHGSLSTTGAEILAGAYNYMKDTRSVKATNAV